MIDTFLETQIEEISSKMIGPINFKGEPVVLLSDAIEALEELAGKIKAEFSQPRPLAVE